MQIDSNYLDNSVVCAHCGHENTHLHSVETFSQKEDSITGIHVTAGIIDGTCTVSVDTDVSGNPSSRRDGVIVYFECETDECGKLTALFIAQHKGADYLSIHPSRRPGRTIPADSFSD